jgi:hypothetical protein
MAIRQRLAIADVHRTPPAQTARRRPASLAGKGAIDASLLENIMLYTVAVVLLVLWILGLATSFTAGGFLHVLLVLAVIAVAYQLITGRRVG